MYLLFGACVCAQSIQLCLTFYYPMDCSLSASSVYGILQAGILDWVAMPTSKGIFATQGSNPSLLHCRQIVYRWAIWNSLLFGIYVLLVYTNIYLLLFSIYQIWYINSRERLSKREETPHSIGREQKGTQRSRGKPKTETIANSVMPTAAKEKKNQGLVNIIWTDCKRTQDWEAEALMIWVRTYYPEH